MKQHISDSYTKVGTMKKSGESIVLEIEDIRFYLMRSDYALLSSGQSAGLVSESGEEEGCAWLSPIREERKKDLVSNLHGRIYVVSWREVQRILNGQVHLSRVFEYSMKGKNGVQLSLQVIQK